MRTSLLALASAVVLGLILGLALALGSGCSPALCGRNSDCEAGEICTAVGQCAVPPADAGTDGADDGSGVTVIDNVPREVAGPGVDGRSPTEGDLR
jgi:hypothetical protein